MNKFQKCPICGHPLVEIEKVSKCLYCKYSSDDNRLIVQPLFRPVVINANQEIAACAHKNLKNNLDGSLEYCHKRGITDHTIDTWQLGYIPDNFSKLSELWPRRILFPIFSNDGAAIIGFGGRKITADDRPKYINSPETQEYSKRLTLYGANLLPIGTDVAYLCEGYVDVLSMDAKGYAYPVASLGTSLTPEQAMLLRGRVRRVVICYDSDEAGHKATARALKILRCAGFDYADIHVMWISDAKDIDEALQHGCSLNEITAQEYLCKLQMFDECADTMLD